MEDNKLQLMATCLHQMGLDVDPASVNLTSEEEFVVVKYRRRDLENGGISSVAKVKKKSTRWSFVRIIEFWDEEKNWLVSSSKLYLRRIPSCL